MASIFGVPGPEDIGTRYVLSYEKIVSEVGMIFDGHISKASFFWHFASSTIPLLRFSLRIITPLHFINARSSPIAASDADLEDSFFMQSMYRSSTDMNSRI